MTQSGFVGVPKPDAGKLPHETQIELLTEELYRMKRRWLSARASLEKSSRKRSRLLEEQKQFYLTNLSQIENLILCNQPLKAADLARKLVVDGT